MVEGIQDLGAAGISCATSELASNGEGGMHVDLTKVLLRDPTLTPGEILMSESQERMMAVVSPENVERFEAIMKKWGVEYSFLGEVTDTGRLTIEWDGQVIVDVDPRTVAHDGPTYERPYARPAGQDALQADHFTGSAADDARPRANSWARLSRRSWRPRICAPSLGLPTSMTATCRATQPSLCRTIRAWCAWTRTPIWGVRAGN